uniref:Uncharacterized protein n=1 Tax=Pyramimonas obovata TaxID=1411642 RepID=A0A7S0RQZ3_9CHLO|mmetsp:Transcript_4216/g.8698  ORF Transcript_4216/g.8698 Transcript_4216/m.8698 type:complete len:363 (+) Transcript_4216:400-1488(+)
MATACVSRWDPLLRGRSNGACVARLPLKSGGWKLISAEVPKHGRRRRSTIGKGHGPGNRSLQVCGQQRTRGGVAQLGQGPDNRSGLKRVQAKAAVRSAKTTDTSKREAAAVAVPLALEDEPEKTKTLEWQRAEQAELTQAPARRPPGARSEVPSETNSAEKVGRDAEELDVDGSTLASPYLLFDPPSSSTRKVAARRSGVFAGGAFGYSQRIVIGVLCALVVGGGVAAFDRGMGAAQDWWDHTNLIQRSAPFYMISLLPYLDFLWKLQQSRPQATRAMVFSFAFVLVFVVISTPVEMYARVHLGKDVADVDPLHFFVQSLIALTNFMIILSFRNEIRRKREENRVEAQAAAEAQQLDPKERT